MDILILDKLIEKIQSRINVNILKGSGANCLGRLTLMNGVDIPRLRHKIQFGNRVTLDRYVSIILSSTEANYGKRYLVDIGDRVYINRFTIIDATEQISIGTETMIGPHCYITDHDHQFQGMPIDKPIGSLPLNGMPTIIERNVWIGSNVTILKGVQIGANSIIGAGSVVSRSIPKNSVAVGVPCKVIRSRS